jgi:hypothetical protein
MGSRLQYNSTYHPQTYVHIDVVNQSLGNLLKSLIGDKLGQWDLVVSQVEFTYNNSINRSICRSPFQVVYGKSLKGFVDLVEFPKVKDKRSVDVDSFAESIWDIHEQVR